MGEEAGYNYLQGSLKSTYLKKMHQSKNVMVVREFPSRNLWAAKSVQVAGSNLCKGFKAGELLACLGHCTEVGQCGCNSASEAEIRKWADFQSLLLGINSEPQPQCCVDSLMVEMLYSSISILLALRKFFKNSLQIENNL